MVLLTLVKDPTPKEAYSLRTYSYAASKGLALCMTAYKYSFVGAILALPSFVSHFSFTKSYNS